MTEVGPFSWPHFTIYDYLITHDLRTKTMTDTLAVVSGGLDSTTLAYYLAEPSGQPPHLVSFDYGQRHRTELDFAAATAASLNTRHDVVDLTAITPHLTGSALTDPTVEVPHGHYAADTMTATVVPNRNMMMISVAAAIAQARGLSRVAVGVHAGDHPVYADCRPSFIDSARIAVEQATDGQVTVVAPFVNETKTDIARHAGRLGLPIDQTWSCYEGGEIHCGRCGTCVERIEALHDAGVEDPTVYADPAYWKSVIS